MVSAYFEKFCNMLDTTSPNRTYWRLIELPYWFHPGFWPKVLGILETQDIKNKSI